jgi:molybdopterin-containing oxidoreductase family membrane subunit
MMIKGISRTTQVWIAVLVILMLIGLVAWINQLSLGLQVTGMRNLVTWGLYIITFTFLVGMSAGGLIVSSATYVFKAERLKSMAPVGVVVAVASVLGAMATIIPDVGHPERLLNILFGMRFTSPITWDFFIVSLYLLVGLFEAWVFFGGRWRNQSEVQRERVLKIAAWIAFPIAILVHSITAWIFGLQIGRPFWNSALMAPIFLSSAIVSGLGLLLVVAFLGRKMNIPGLGEEGRSSIASLLAAFVTLDLFLLFCDLFTAIYAGQPGEAAGANVLVGGSLAPLFWSEILFGALLPLLILGLPQTRRAPSWLGLAGALAMLGVFAKRINIIMPGYLQTENIPFAPGVSTGDFIPAAGNLYIAGQSSFSMVPTYLPTITEIAITLGILAMVAFVVTAGVQLVVNRSLVQGAAA